MDLSARMAALSGRPALAGDEEWLPFAPESFDLVVANLSLHWVNDLPGALVQIRRCLRPDGLFLASLPGLGTLGPLRDALAAAEARAAGRRFAARLAVSGPAGFGRAAAARGLRAAGGGRGGVAARLSHAGGAARATCATRARRTRCWRGTGGCRRGCCCRWRWRGWRRSCRRAGGVQAGAAAADGDGLGAAREPIEAGAAGQRRGAPGRRAGRGGAERGGAGSVAGTVTARRRRRLRPAPYRRTCEPAGLGGCAART